MPKISSSQLRAARALLNWSRPQLSKQSGISEPTLHRFENGMNEPEIRTINKLINVFEKNNVEFCENQGVRFKSSSIDIYDGKERFDDFYEYLYEQLSQFGGDVCVSVYNETLFASNRKDPIIHLRRMKRLFEQKKITFRILTTISNFEANGYAVFRWLPKRTPSPVGFYAFGDSLALISFVDRDSPYVVVIRSASLAEGYRQEFNIGWSLGQKPPSPSEIAKILSGRHSPELGG